MSNLSALPTAIVSPVIPVSEEVKSVEADQRSSVSFRKHQSNADNSWSNLNEYSCGGTSVLQSMCSTSPNSQNSIKKLKFSPCSKIRFSNLSSCTVELKKFQHLDGKFTKNKLVNSSESTNSVDKCYKQQLVDNSGKNAISDSDSDDDLCLQTWMQQNLWKTKKRSQRKPYVAKRKPRTINTKNSKSNVIETRETIENSCAELDKPFVLCSSAL